MRAEPLGSLLVSRGHITEDELELALTEQKATGRPLGEIVVARGFAAAPTVADAGGVMPPKSTWFEPKLRDAMFCHII